MSEANPSVPADLDAPMVMSDAALSVSMPLDGDADGELLALRKILDGTSSSVGEAFLKSLVENLATAIDAQYAFVTEFLPDISSVRTLAFWGKGKHLPEVQWELAGTPCEDVVRGNLCHYPRNVAELFPRDTGLVDLKIQSFLGVPLRDVDGNALGHLAVFDERPMPAQPKRLYTFRIFAARAAAELQRLRAERRLAESERRYRDLYEEAPIAYIYEDLESRFVRANRAACKLLGVKPDEVTSTYGVSLLAPTPETKQRVQEALDAMKTQGKEFACVELELRRKDDGRPIWVQWWSKPEPDGKHTRTMIVDITERVLMQREKARLEQQNLYLQEEIKSDHNFEEIIGQSAALKAVLENVRRVAPTEASVLITGETGTGKELIARAIHSSGGRKDKPLIKVNCAALPTGLVESELFGHERGAFSGAISRHIGRFELAHGGTIFLDEIGEIPLDVQAKLLRVLQEHELERVGGTAAIKSDVRVIAATNRDLAACVREGTFREDLFYRLNVFPVHLPPLRERPTDLPLLVRFLVQKFSNRVGKRIDAVSHETMDRLVKYPWPGNVRELQNVLERAVILCNASLLEVGSEQLPAAAIPTAAPTTAPVSTPAGSGSLKEVEREHIVAALIRANWVIEGTAGAAQALKMHPNTLRSRMKKLGISRPSHRIS
jgi:PAS domain S-box-containing protein